MNELVSANKASALYHRMQTAIAECHAIDDCKTIAEQAGAISAYYKQIKDDESVRKFMSVKMRAWRRIGEICAQVSADDCQTKTAYYQKINDLFPDVSVSQISSALRLAEVPQDFFDAAMQRDGASVSGIIYGYQNHLEKLWRQSPEGQEAQRRHEKQLKENEKRRREEDARRMEEEQEEQRNAELRLKRSREEDAQKKELWENFVKAGEEVGYTLDRRDRRRMKSVVLLLREELHTQLRQAAFDRKLTMQEVLRQGLSIWLTINGYQTDKDAA